MIKPLYYLLETSVLYEQKTYNCIMSETNGLTALTRDRSAGVFHPAFLAYGIPIKFNLFRSDLVCIKNLAATHTAAIHLLFMWFLSDIKSGSN